MNIRTRNRIRSARGVTGSIEIAASALFMVVLALLGMDMAMVIFGISMNDRACRDAARAAAGANTQQKAWTLAQSSLKSYGADGFFISPPQLLNPPAFVYQDFSGAPNNGTPPAGTSPYVTVTTQCTVRVPAPIFFFGASFIKSGMAQFTQCYTFPIVRTQFVKYSNAG